jgi:UDP-galactopyranose mutase
MTRTLPDVVCFSHLRWNFVFQRPQHLMTRFAKHARVYFVEEPVFGGDAPTLHVAEADGVQVLTPHLPVSPRERTDEDLLREMIELHATREGIQAPLFWFYTPMALGLGGRITPKLVVYDCMDELTGFLGAPPELTRREDALFAMADIVFTGGQSLYEAKRTQHPNVHAFPSSVDAEHFRAARHSVSDAGRSRRPRVGFFGVIDERMDVGLVEALTIARPDIDFVLVGPVVKIDPATLPARPNLLYPGPRSYADLPACIADWDVAMMPFARNDSTRFISPTKTLEYMAAGKPIVSTAIRDVVRPYGEAGLVRIAGDAPSFARAIDQALAEDEGDRLRAFDAFLAGTSWDRTWQRMRALIDAGLDARARSPRNGGDGGSEARGPYREARGVESA